MTDEKLEKSLDSLAWYGATGEERSRALRAFREVFLKESAPELAALRECVRAMDVYLESLHEIVRATGSTLGEWREKNAYYEARAKVKL